MNKFLHGHGTIYNGPNDGTKHKCDQTSNRGKGGT